MPITKKGKREKRKKELRKRVIDARNSNEVGDDDLDEYDDFLNEATIEDELAELEEAEKAIKKKRLSRVTKIFIVIGAIILALLIWLFVERFITYSSYSISSTSDSGMSGETIEYFNDNLIKFSSSGIKYTDYDDEVIWEYVTSMSTPVFAHSENYGIVYDTDGTQIVVFDEKNALAKISTDYQIITAKISNQGVTAVLVKDGNSSLVWFYDNIGTKLEIEIKNVLGENGGYPIGMDISPSGVGVATPLMSVSGSGYKTDLTFYNFDKGKDNPNRTVGSFEYDGTIFPEMKYLSNSRAVCFGTDKVCFYSLKDAAAPELEKEVGYDNEIVSVITGEDRAVVISKSNMGGYLLTVYNDNGKVIDEENFAFEYTNAEITNGYILVYGTDGALIETTAGHLKYCGEMDGITLKMIPTGKGKFLQFGNYGKRTIKIP